MISKLPKIYAVENKKNTAKDALFLVGGMAHVAWVK